MKLSNIILLSLIGSISAAIIVGSLQLRLTGKLRSPLTIKRVDTLSVAPFRHLVINRAWNLTIVPASEPGIIVQSAMDGAKPGVHYHMSGDTLHIDSLQWSRDFRMSWISIQTPGGLERIHGKGASFTLMDYNGGALIVKLDDCRFTMNAGNGASRIERLQITEKNGSDFDAHQVSFDTVAIDLLDSRASLAGEIGKLRGSLKNGSYLRAPGATDIQLRKDPGSTWQN